MRKLILSITILLSISAVLTGCFEEETIYAELGQNKRTYDTTSSDPVLKIVSQYYYDFNKYLIVDPDSSDYLYNFQWKNEIWMQMPAQDETHLLAGIEFFEEMFANSFTDEFKKDVFPLYIFLTDSIAKTNGVYWEPVNMYIQPNQFYIAFSISEQMLNMTEEEKQELSFDWLMDFLVNYCSKKGVGLELPEEFYTTSEEYYGRHKSTIEEEGILPPEEWYERGFLSVQDQDSYEDFWDECLYYYTDFPSYRETDLSMFITAICTMDEEELMQIVNNYPKVKTRYELLNQAFQNIGIDYRNMGYKAKE